MSSGIRQHEDTKSEVDGWDAKTHRDYHYYGFAKWMYHPDGLERVRRAQFRDVRPVTAQIVPTLFCNFRCPRCSYGGSKIQMQERRERSLMNMDLPTMELVLDRLADGGVKGVVFTGGGEPAMSPYLLQGMAHATKRGLKIGLFTNGSMLTKEQVRDMLELNPVFLRVSLDAGTPATHALIHGYDVGEEHFEKSCRTIEEMAKQKKRLGVSTTIGVGVSVEPVNLHDLEKVAHVLRKIHDVPPVGGIDYVVFRPVVSYRCGGYDHRVVPVLQWLMEHEPAFYKAYWSYIYEGKQFPPDLFDQASELIDGPVTSCLRDTNVRVINIRTKMHGVSSAARPFCKCRASPWYIFVGPDATVYNCVELGLEPRVAIGRLSDNTLDEIWRSDRRRRVLDYIDGEGLRSLCPPVCLYYEMNALFEDVEQDMQAGKSSAATWITTQMRRIDDERRAGNESQPHIEFI